MRGVVDCLSKLSVASLRERLRSKGLTVSGCKADLIKRLGGVAHRVHTAPSVRGSLEDGRRAVRKTIKAGAWNMSLLDWYVRPPPVLPCGTPNLVCDLGECGDGHCMLTRLKPGCESVRDDFLEFSATKIKDYAEGNRIVYCSLGPGCLYFDWKLIDRLLKDGVGVAQVWLLDRAYRGGSGERRRVLSARAAFARWFAGSGIDIHAFKSARELKRWARAFPEAGRADVVMQCDAVETLPILDKDAEFRELVLKDAALNLQAYSQRLSKRKPGPGRRRDPVQSVAVRRVRQRDEDTHGPFALLEDESWKGGEWVDAFDELADQLMGLLQNEYR